MRSANDFSCLSANCRLRPAGGSTIPAHNPSAPGVTQASLAHCQRRGQARHSALAPSSAVVVQRSGSCVQGAVQTLSAAAIGYMFPPLPISNVNSTIRLYRKFVIAVEAEWE